MRQHLFVVGELFIWIWALNCPEGDDPNTHDHCIHMETTPMYVYYALFLINYKHKTGTELMYRLRFRNCVHLLRAKSNRLAPCLISNTDLA